MDKSVGTRANIKKYCKYCGHELGDDGRCPNCNKAEETKLAKAKWAKARKIILLVVVLIVLVAVIVSDIFLYLDEKFDKSNNGQSNQSQSDVRHTTSVAPKPPLPLETLSSSEVLNKIKADAETVVMNSHYKGDSVLWDVDTWEPASAVYKGFL